MSLTPKEMEQRLQEMRARFAGKLAARLDEVEAALSRARNGDAKALATLRHLTHKLHGTAGSYGLHDVANTLREMETTVDAVAAGNGPQDPWTGLAADLERARAGATK